mgnify:CR=1 FL=1
MLEPLAVLVGMVAVILSIYKNKTCWLLWIMADLVLAYVNFKAGNFWQGFMWVVYTGAAVWGLCKWSQEEVIFKKVLDKAF